MIGDLHKLRDLLTCFEYDDPDPAMIDQALDLIEKLIVANETPVRDKPNACMRVPTPPPPAPPPPAPVAPPAPRFSGRQRKDGQKFTVARKPRQKKKVKPDAAA